MRHLIGWEKFWWLHCWSTNVQKFRLLIIDLDCSEPFALTSKSRGSLLENIPCENMLCPKYFRCLWKKTNSFRKFINIWNKQVFQNIKIKAKLQSVQIQYWKTFQRRKPFKRFNWSFLYVTLHVACFIRNFCAVPKQCFCRNRTIKVFNILKTTLLGTKFATKATVLKN